MATTMRILRIILILLWSWFAGTLLFDVVHCIMHRWSKSPYRLLRRLANVHMVHHYYFDRKLKFNNHYYWRNLMLELPLELSCQLLGAYLGVLSFKRLSPEPNHGPIPPRENDSLAQDSIGKALLLGNRTTPLVCALFVVLVARVVVVFMLGGRDSNHETYKSVPKDPNWVIVGPEYHALHHIQPQAYLSSAIRVFDFIFGSSHSIQSRRITMTGASGAFGTALRKELGNLRVKEIKSLKYGTDWTYQNFEKVIAVLKETDILVLSHGSKDANSFEANCTSAINLIHLFKQHRIHATTADNLLLPEVWYVGSEIEFHSSWGSPGLSMYSCSKRAFLPYARSLYEDTSLIYRHIVPSAFDSPMGPAVVSASWAARCALWWIKRGARYVPVTYTGFAYLNFFKFMYFIESKRLDQAPGHICGLMSSD